MITLRVKATTKEAMARLELWRKKLGLDQGKIVTPNKSERKN